MSGAYERIYTIVRQFPAGKVASYGQIARLAGTSARQVGYAMAALAPDTEVPWQRVINSKGAISPRRGNDGHRHQRIVLEEEGIAFSPHGKIDMDSHSWEGTLSDDLVSESLIYEKNIM